MEDYGLVSVIMPNYNCERFIEEAINSIIAQTYKHWELLVVDDCSTDNSLLILKRISEQEPRVKVLQNEKKSGAAISRNYAIREASGKWIAFLDSDDLWISNKLEIQIAYMNNNNINFSYTNSEYIDENGKTLNIFETGPSKVSYSLFLLFNFVSTCSVVYNKEYIGTVQIPDLKKRNDYAIWLKLSKKTPCCLVDKNLAKYRIRSSGNLSGKSKGIWGQRDLLKKHYIMFHYSENYNFFISWTLVALNIVGYLLKNVLYINKR